MTAHPDAVFDYTDAMLEAAIDQAVAKERERCAKIAYEYAKELGEPAIGHAIAQKIRNSSE